MKRLIVAVFILLSIGTQAQWLQDRVQVASKTGLNYVFEGIVKDTDTLWSKGLNFVGDDLNYNVHYSGDSTRVRLLAMGSWDNSNWYALDTIAIDSNRTKTARTARGTFDYNLIQPPFTKIVFYGFDAGAGVTNDSTKIKLFIYRRP